MPWLSGTASWSHLSAIQYILGLRPEVDGLRIDPCIPKSWDGFEAERNFRGATVTIRVQNPRHHSKGVTRLTVDGAVIEGNLLSVGRLRNGLVIEA